MTLSLKRISLGTTAGWACEWGGGQWGLYTRDTDQGALNVHSVLTAADPQAPMNQVAFHFRESEYRKQPPGSALLLLCSTGYRACLGR